MKAILRAVIIVIVASPFFTTKPEGTGIGLSLSRQIMRMHHGSISAVSEGEKHTVFTLKF